jgi:predicted RNase H-like HicB family nuclease
MKAKDRRFHIRFELDEEDGGYTVSVPELPGCITCADTLEEGFEMIKDAMSGWLEVSRNQGDPIGAAFEPIMDELRVPKERKAVSA